MIGRKPAFLIFPLSLVLFLVSCAFPFLWNIEREITIMTYNVHNLFNAVSEGGEYPEYDPSGGEWTEEEYEKRLANTADIIRGAVRGGPDIVLVQEIERLSVLRDLAEGYLAGMGYSVYGVENTANASTVMVGALSRVPVTKSLVHAVQMPDGRVGRGILELWLSSGGVPVVVFNNHWKSKTGGAEETEPQRVAEASLLSARIAEILERGEALDIVAAGDLNEQIEEFERSGRCYPTALGQKGGTGTILVLPIPASSSAENQAGSEGALTLLSPWFDVEQGGSYWYNGEWERIDHVLMTPGLLDGEGFDYAAFSVVSLPFMLSEGGTPLVWSSRTGRGYSDHLPLLLTLERK